MLSARLGRQRLRRPAPQRRHPGHRARWLPACKLVGPAVTVRTYPGDWAKPVEAIDQAEPGDVLVIDAGGVLPAIWGELATNSAIQQRLAGVVIYGRRPRHRRHHARWASRCSRPSSRPTAGEPKGFGEIGVPIKINGVRISPGDWIIGDDDGVCVIPKDKAVEYTNRAMDVLEKENRLRKEIQAGSTLSQVGYLQRWEKK